MKKILLIMLCLALVMSFSGCNGVLQAEDSWGWSEEPAAKPTGVTLNVYNWGEYIAPDTNDAFEHLTGIKVNYKQFTDNESMYATLMAGVKYDVIIPSDYMVGKMRNEGLLEPLNFENIPNFALIDDDLKNPDYDPENRYSVPYTWGTVGIFYNDKFVDEADLAQGWDLLWDEKYAGKIFMFDNPRDAFGIALKRLGYSMNSTDKSQIEEAYWSLREQKPILQQYVMDQVYSKMINEEGWIAPYYTGDGVIMMDEEEGNKHIRCFVPEEGTNLFVDAMCIPKGVKHKSQAEAYINFMCRTEVALANAEEIGYSTPHVEALDQLDPFYADNPVFYPPDDVLNKAEIYIALPESWNTYYAELWERLKM